MNIKSQSEQGQLRSMVGAILPDWMDNYHHRSQIAKFYRDSCPKANSCHTLRWHGKEAIKFWMEKKPHRSKNMLDYYRAYPL